MHLEHFFTWPVFPHVRQVSSLGSGGSIGENSFAKLSAGVVGFGELLATGVVTSVNDAVPSEVATPNICSRRVAMSNRS